MRWIVACLLALSILQTVHGQIDSDGKPRLWDRLVHAHLAPELQELSNKLKSEATPAFDAMEVIKDAVDHKHLPSLPDFAFPESLPTVAIAKGIIDSMTPSFKLPPGAAFPMAPSVGHMYVEAGNGLQGIPNLAKNMDSAIQKDAINAGLGTTRLFRPQQEGNIPLDAFSTRQTADHPRFPTYANYLKQLQHSLAITPGLGIGGVPAAGLKAISAINPFVPFSPGPLGSGVDFFGLSRAQMSRPLDEAGGVHLLTPFSFSPQTVGAVSSGAEQGFSIPQAFAGQLKNDVVNLVPKALAYGMSTSVSPMSGIQPWFA